MGRKLGVLLVKRVLNGIVLRDPCRERGGFRRPHALLEQRRGFADGQHQFVLATGHHVDAAKHALGELGLVEQGVRCMGLRLSSIRSRREAPS